MSRKAREQSQATAPKFPHPRTHAPSTGAASAESDLRRARAARDDDYDGDDNDESEAQQNGGGGGRSRASSKAAMEEVDFEVPAGGASKWEAASRQAIRREDALWDSPDKPEVRARAVF